MKSVEYALVNPWATEADVRRHCGHAMEQGFGSVSVAGHWLPLCARMLDSAGIMLATSVNFPFGTAFPVVKAYEAVRAIQFGATKEIAVMMNHGLISAGDMPAVTEEIRLLKYEIFGSSGTRKLLSSSSRLGIIIDAYLGEDDFLRLCQQAMVESVFVQIGTGLSGEVVRPEDVSFAKGVVGDSVELKAAMTEGIDRSFDTGKAAALLKAGATKVVLAADASAVFSKKPGVVRGEMGGV